MITLTYNLKNEAAGYRNIAFQSPVVTPALGLSHDLTLLLSYPQAAFAGKGFESLNHKNENDTKSEYPTPPIALASPHWEICS